MIKIYNKTLDYCYDHEEKKPLVVGDVIVALGKDKDLLLIEIVNILRRNGGDGNPKYIGRHYNKGRYNGKKNSILNKLLLHLS